MTMSYRPLHDTLILFFTDTMITVLLYFIIGGWGRACGPNGKEEATALSTTGAGWVASNLRPFTSYTPPTTTSGPQNFPPLGHTAALPHHPEDNQDPDRTWVRCCQPANKFWSFTLQGWAYKKTVQHTPNGMRQLAITPSVVSSWVHGVSITHCAQAVAPHVPWLSNSPRLSLTTLYKPQLL